MTQDYKAATIIASNRYLTLATSSGQAVWATPLAYTVEPDFSLLFYSASDSIHCTNLNKVPRVAGAIFNSTEPSDTVDGLQFEGMAREFGGGLAELEAAMDRYFRLSFPIEADRQRWIRPVADFNGSALQRFYQIELHRLFKIDPDSTKVDRRLELDIELVKQHYFAAMR